MLIGVSCIHRVPSWGISFHNGSGAELFVRGMSSVLPPQVSMLCIAIQVTRGNGGKTFMTYLYLVQITQTMCVYIYTQ